MTCTEVFERMNEMFQQMRLKDVYGVFQFDISGREGGQWHAVCRGDSVQVSRGQAAKPDVTFAASDQNVVKLAQGRLSPTAALLTRRVKIKGDLLLAAKIQGMVSRAM